MTVVRKTALDVENPKTIKDFLLKFLSRRYILVLLSLIGSAISPEMREVVLDNWQVAALGLAFIIGDSGVKITKAILEWMQEQPK